MKASHAACVACMLVAWGSQAASARAVPQGPPSSPEPGPAAQLAAAINAFGETLFSTLTSKGTGSGPGVFLSPFGISQALGMLLNGADPGGQSYSQLQSVAFGGQGGRQLGVDEVNSQMQQLAGTLLQARPIICFTATGVPSNGSLMVSNANSAWVAENYTLQQQFVDDLARYYSAQAEPITTAEAVNSWVSNATRGKIDEIVDEGTLSAAALLLVNALYFKGLWEAPFDKAETQSAPFRQLSGSAVDVAMMRKEFQDYNGEAAQVVRFLAPGPVAGNANSSAIPCVAVKLAYHGGQYSAVLAMPEGNVSKTSAGPLRLMAPSFTYEEALSACRAQLMKGLGGSANLTFARTGSSLILYIPRFEMEFEASLKAPLQEMGLTKPFQGGDLTHIATADGQPAGGLLVDDVLHKVYIKLDEEGTEAAATTAALIKIKDILAGPPVLRYNRPFSLKFMHEPAGEVDEEGTEAAAVTGIVALTSANIKEPQTITLDRPYVLAVLHNRSRAVLFLGQVLSPEKWGTSN